MEWKLLKREEQKRRLPRKGRRRTIGGGPKEEEQRRRLSRRDRRRTIEGVDWDWQKKEAEVAAGGRSNALRFGREPQCVEPGVRESKTNLLVAK